MRAILLAMLTFCLLVAGCGDEGFDSSAASRTPNTECENHDGVQSVDFSDGGWYLVVCKDGFYSEWEAS